jgi:hypothetical protein
LKYIFLFFAVFSSEHKSDEELYLQRNQELEQRSRDLEKQEDIFQKRVRAIEKKLQNREEKLFAREQKDKNLQQREKNVLVQEESLLFQEKYLKHMQTDLFAWEQRLCARKNRVNIAGGILNVFPNEGSIKVFRDMETKNIFFKDPKCFITSELKEEIESSLKQKGEAMANMLFNCVSNCFRFPSPKSDVCFFVTRVMFSVSKAIDVDKRNKNFVSPMMYAAYIDATEAVINLIQRGAEMRAVDGYGNIALHWAAVGGHESSCKILLEAGANINSQTNTGYTALMFAVEQAHMEVVQILLENWADSKIKNNRGFTALALCKKSLQELNSAKPNCADVIKAYEAKLEGTKVILPII